MRRSAVLGTVVMAVTSLAVGGGADAGASKSPPTPAPAAVLGANMSGEDAVAALGARLPAVAAAAGMEPNELRTELLKDDELWIDRTGTPMFVDEALADYPVANGSEPPVEAAPYPYADTFTLHSLPTSKRTIYLDFDGATVTGTSWNSSYTASEPFVAAPFDADGTPESFSDEEKDAIQSVWQRVAEDYAPFDIDVTTEEPDQARITRSDADDDTYGTRLLITNTSTILTVCGCGGIAYLGVFDAPSTHASYQPAFVFTRDNQNPKFIAEAASHEVGHNLGLAHDGTASAGYYGGHANWAPIMGVGYSRPVTQWSKGEYKGANNKQDDFSVMAENGGLIRADDHADTTLAAEFLGSTFPIEEDGVITTAKDIDLLKFNAGAGEITVTVAVAETSPNLDVAVELLTSKGKSLSKVDPVSGGTGDTATGLDATLTTTLAAAGTYYVKIDGTKVGSGSNGYSDYGSVGAYTVEIAATSPTGLANVAPIAKITAPKVIGVPGPVSFTNNGSTDPDGRITGTTWNFGDNTAAGSGASVSHSYSTVGDYTVTMTVTDNTSASTVKTLKIKAVPAITVDTISVAKTLSSGKYTTSTTLKIVDADGAAVSGASVGVSYTYGAKKATGSGKTGSDGTVVLKGPVATAGTVVTATVTKVSLKDKAFNPDLADTITGSVTI